jgi:sarcosine oxidase subunit beta
VPCLEHVRVPFERLHRQEVQDRFGTPLGLDLTCYGPPKRIEDELFGVPNEQDEITGGIYIPTTGYISDPQLATLNLQVAAEATGRAQFRFQSTVTSVNRSNHRVAGITLHDGIRWEAPIVVNAAGPSSNQITSLAFGEYGDNDMNLTTRPLRQEVAYVSAPQGIVQSNTMLPVMGDLDVGVYVRTEHGIHDIVIGSTEPECDYPLEFLDDEAEADMNLSSIHTSHIYRWALRMPELPLPSAAETRGIVACYDVTEDWTPIYDQSALSGFYMAIGTSGNQFKNAGVVGVMMAELIDRCETNPETINHDDAPLQFQLNYTDGGTINTAMFSRLRKTLNTSGTVLG